MMARWLRYLTRNGANRHDGGSEVLDKHLDELMERMLAMVFS